MLVLGAIALLTLPVLAADAVVGKKGQTLPVIDSPASPGSATRADVEYNTAGAIDAMATTGGSADGWGEYFITSWTNTTGQDVELLEFGWPCGGLGPVDWVVWITETLPGAPGTEGFNGQWTPVSSDDVTNPPTTYTYIDVTGAGIMIPDGATFYFGYENPGLGGQVDFNGVDTWAWYFGDWDPDQGWGRTAVLQFKGTFGGVAAEASTLTQVKHLFD
jgi:hypothetical protein